MDVTEADLAEMETEVAGYCEKMGWREQESPFEQSMALLHEEAAEAGSAWRKWGLADHTAQESEAMPGFVPKPEGVGSEFADVFIRALDDSHLYQLGLPRLIVSRGGGFGINAGFLVNINTLHGLVARTSMAWDAQPDHFYRPEDCLADVVRFTMQLAGHYGIDLLAEYRRKMDYNWTRPYRHGGKRA